MTKFTKLNLVDVDKSLIHETLRLYYESLNQFQQALIQFIMSIHQNNRNNTNNDKNRLIIVSHWKIDKISSSCVLNNGIC